MGAEDQAALQCQGLSLKDTENLAGALAWQDCSENGPDANLEEKPRLEYPAQLDKVILKKAKRGARRGAREATATVQWAAVTAKTAADGGERNGRGERTMQQRERSRRAGGISRRRKCVGHDLYILRPNTR